MAKSQQFYFNTLQGGNVGVESVGTKVDINLRKMHFKFLTRRIKHLTRQKIAGGGGGEGKRGSPDWTFGGGAQIGSGGGCTTVVLFY